MRCFIGIAVDHHLGLDLLTERDRAVAALEPADPRPVEARNFHLTLLFLGALDAGQVESVRRVMTAVGRRHRAFSQPLHLAHMFPGRGARLFALEGPATPSFIALHSDLKESLSGQGLALGLEQGRVRPHLTLLRARRSCSPAPSWPVEIEVPVGELVLFESVQGERGSEYGQLASAWLNTIG